MPTVHIFFGPSHSDLDIHGRDFVPLNLAEQLSTEQEQEYYTKYTWTGKTDRYTYDFQSSDQVLEWLQFHAKPNDKQAPGETDNERIWFPASPVTPLIPTSFLGLLHDSATMNPGRVWDSVYHRSILAVRQVQSLLGVGGIFALSLFSNHIVPAAARETAINSKDRPPPPRTPRQKSNVMVGITIGIVMVVLCASVGIVLASRRRIRGTMRSLLGPMMGATSILWVMMRNDPAVKPELSWIVFGIWVPFILTYISCQYHSVAHANLYCLVLLTFAGVCLCMLASVQNSSISQGGLATVIPLCTSFSSYAVSFFFPPKRDNIMLLAV